MPKSSKPTQPLASVFQGAAVSARFVKNGSQGRCTDLSWTVRRSVKMTPASRDWLRAQAKLVSAKAKKCISPMQLAGILLEQAIRKHR